jgi:hypothetical protein
LVKKMTFIRVRLARPVRVEHFLVVEAVVNRFQNSFNGQSIFFGDVFRGEWLQADSLPVNYLRANSPIHEKLPIVRPGFGASGTYIPLARP